MKRLNKKQIKRLRQFGGKTLITGASSGIGKVMAKYLASCQLDLILVARSKETLHQLQAEFQEEHGVHVEVFIADLSFEHECNRLMRSTEQSHIGMFIHAAGYGTSGEFVFNSLEEEANMLSLNCQATLLLTHHYASKMATQRNGAIMLFSSILALQGTPFSANYAASKAYVQSFGEALAVELKSKGIMVGIAAPGPTQTGFADRADMVMNGAMSAEEVGFDLVKNLGKPGTIYPGRMGKFLVYSLKLLPRFAKIKVMKQLMKGMTQQDNKK